VDKLREEETHVDGNDSTEGQNSIRFIRWKRAEKHNDSYRDHYTVRRGKVRIVYTNIEAVTCSLMQMITRSFDRSKTFI